MKAIRRFKRKLRALTAQKARLVRELRALRKTCLVHAAVLKAGIEREVP